MDKVYTVGKISFKKLLVIIIRYPLEKVIIFVTFSPNFNDLFLEWHLIAYVAN